MPVNECVDLNQYCVSPPKKNGERDCEVLAVVLIGLGTAVDVFNTMAQAPIPANQFTTIPDSVHFAVDKEGCSYE